MPFKMKMIPLVGAIALAYPGVFFGGMDAVTGPLMRQMK